MAIVDKIKRLLMPNVSVSEPKSFQANTILLFADPRSGSTWLAEILNNLPESLIIDEPLNLNKVAYLRKGGFGWRQPIPIDAHWDLPLRYFTDLLEGKKIPKSLIDQVPFRVASIQTPIFKIIRGKLMADWILANYEITRKPVYLIRHPLAVIASMKNHPSWQYEYKPFELPDLPFHEVYVPHLSYLEKLSSKEEQLLALWCIANEAIKNIELLEKDYQLVFYEDLLEDSVRVITRLLTEWGLTYDPEMFASIQVPSRTSMSREAIKPDEQLRRWQNELSEVEKSAYQEVLDHFEISIYSQKDIYPIKN